MAKFHVLRQVVKLSFPLFFFFFFKPTIPQGNASTGMVVLKQEVCSLGHGEGFLIKSLFATFW